MMADELQYPEFDYERLLRESGAEWGCDCGCGGDLMPSYLEGGPDPRINRGTVREVTAPPNNTTDYDRLVAGEAASVVNNWTTLSATMIRNFYRDQMIGLPDVVPQNPTEAWPELRGQEIEAVFYDEAEVERNPNAFGLCGCNLCVADRERRSVARANSQAVLRSRDVNGVVFFSALEREDDDFE